MNFELLFASASTRARIAADAARKIVRKSKQLQRTLGVRSAAGYLRNQGVSFDQAHIVLLGRVAR